MFIPYLVAAKTKYLNQPKKYLCLKAKLLLLCKCMQIASGVIRKKGWQIAYACAVTYICILEAITWMAIGFSRYEEASFTECKRDLYSFT